MFGLLPFQRLRLLAFCVHPRLQPPYQPLAPLEHTPLTPRTPTATRTRALRTHPHKITKQGQNYERYESGEVVTPDTVHYAPGLKHCVHPAFMRDQLSRSLGRLGMEGLDVFLLHNPEYYLTHSVKPGVGTVELAKHKAEMERRIFESFKALEAEIATGNGRLRSYGAWDCVYM